MDNDTTVQPSVMGPFSRRDFMKLTAGAGFAALVATAGWPDGYAFAAGPGGVSSLGTGYVPEQVHLMFGADPSTAMTISWASPQLETQPQVSFSTGGGTPVVVAATEKQYTDGLSGETVYCYHAQLAGLTPGTTYTYTVADPAETAATFTSTFTTAQTGRFPFAFTSFGDLATPGAGATYTLADGSTIESSTYSESQWNCYNAVNEIETLSPLFHLMNGDLAYADKVTISSTGATAPGSAGVQPAPEVWRDYALNVQRSAANRPWMYAIGNHEAELDNGPQGYASFNTRFLVPGNPTPYSGNFYAFRVGSVQFVCLDANDICYQGAGAYNVGLHAATDSHGNPIPTTEVQYNQFYTGGFAENADGTWSATAPTTIGPATPNAQTVWLEGVLAAARADTTCDWIVVSMHQCALSSTTDNGCDLAIRQAWVPLFDQYEVDVVVNGHDHDYERSWPVRGFTPNLGTSTFAGGVVNQASGLVNLPSTSGQTVNTLTPKVVTTDQTSPFDTTKGTVYLTLGGGGTDKRDNVYEMGIALVTTFTQIRSGAAVGSLGAGVKPVPDANEPSTWSAMTDAAQAYGVAYFSVDPGQPGGNTTISVTYYHAPTQTSGAPAYTVKETYAFTRPRSDNNPPVVPEFSAPALVVGGTVALAAGALLVQQRRHAAASARLLEAGAAPVPSAPSEYN